MVLPENIYLPFKDRYVFSLKSFLSALRAIARTAQIFESTGSSSYVCDSQSIAVRLPPGGIVHLF